MTPEKTTRLQEILQKKITQVQTAEISGTWQEKTIKQETEFILLIKTLIAENHELSLNATPDINSEKFINSFIRELDYFDLRFEHFWGEIRLYKKGFSAFEK